MMFKTLVPLTILLGFSTIDHAIAASLRGPALAARNLPSIGSKTNSDTSFQSLEDLLTPFHEDYNVTTYDELSSQKAMALIGPVRGFILKGLVNGALGKVGGEATG